MVKPMSDLDIPDDVIATLSDYLDNALPPAERAEVDKKLAEDELWKRAHAELAGTRDALSGLQKARAPVSFAADVTSTIHKRSAGQLFGKRTVGDKVPFLALVVLAVMAVVVIAFLMWTSELGTSHPAPTAPGAPGSGSAALVDRPL
jgi:anti-sigma factor RsiW